MPIRRRPDGMTAPPRVALCGITKRFPGVVALDDVSLGLHAGEVHMVMGENGAGKSTLMKVLCGAYAADGGHFEHDGRRVVVANTKDARKLGIAVIFQEYSLVPYLSVAQNIYLGREPMRAGILVDHASMLRDARIVLDRIGLDIDPRRAVDGLGIAQQQMVEIAKALSQHASVLVLDEPTAALSDRESERLFAVIAELRREGVAMAYISHRMAEVFSLGDRVTVLRDGKGVATMLADEATPDALVTMMVGRQVDMSYRRDARPAPGACALELRDVSAANGIREVSLTVCKGEIVGLAGLVGSGRTEVARAIFGADPVTGGSVLVEGTPLHGGPTAARRRGLALIPESRKTQGLALARTVGDNLLLAALPRLFRSHVFRPSRAADASRSIIAKLRIATPGPRQISGLLSGGNQQKIVIGKWLLADTRIYLFDEPTRGIDVGAKEEIFRLLDRLAHEGHAILMISSELSEIVRVCDRAYVMKERRVAGEVSRADLSEESLLRLAMHHA